MTPLRHIHDQVGAVLGLVLIALLSLAPTKEERDSYYKADKCPECDIDPEVVVPIHQVRHEPGITDPDHQQRRRAVCFKLFPIHIRKVTDLAQ